MFPSAKSFKGRIRTRNAAGIDQFLGLWVKIKYISAESDDPGFMIGTFDGYGWEKSRGIFRKGHMIVSGHLVEFDRDEKVTIRSINNYG